MILNNIYESIGNTPIIKLNNLQEEDSAEIFVKVESFNPSGSIKDRAALYMIEGAEQKGILKKGDTIIEPTSGNTGIGLAMIGASKGYRVILVMPDTMSLERRKILKAYGAELILTDGKKGMSGSVEKAKKLAKENRYFMPDQFSNQNNAKAHYETTAEEIIKDTQKKLDVFIAGVGTGGTVSGVGKKLKEVIKGIYIVAVEPTESQVLSGKDPAPHKIQGLGANFVPSIFDREVVDEIIHIGAEEAFKYARLLGEKEGILCGISSGANLAAAMIMAKRLGKNHRILTVLPDTGERYLSTDLLLGE
ncbi:cysteine synthase A [Tissierella creatinophila]|uniref:Cysteine synthase n=1 Tax=Tissierella creatinophila DSM 6911 TaxID=1123403 RepID=A0A1U7M6Z7_TISCR|nr:cysteine synthase A [Tissierella creatinophila]OLS03055.1 cysteine synthase [Tissierella creatinophila DSM 6911]